MNSLDLAVMKALESSGGQQEANKAYLEFIKANFLVPVENNSVEVEVLYLQENNHFYLPVFTDKIFLDLWACDISAQINVLTLTGVDLLKGIGDQVTVCLNIGSEHYKEFIPAELARMRSMVLKLFK